MKKLLSMMLFITAMVFTLSACSSDDDEKKEREREKDTTYIFNYTGDNPQGGLIVNVTLFEYNSQGEVVKQNAVNNCKQGFQRQYTANANAQKVKVYIEVTNGTKSVYNWVQQVYYLEKGKNVAVDVTGSVRIAPTEP